MGLLIFIEKWAENLEEVTLSRWLKREGEFADEGEALCEIITDKVTFEYEVELPGFVRRRYCPDKSILPVGYAIAFIGDEDEPLPGGVEKRNRELLQERAARVALDLDLQPASAAAASPRTRRDRLPQRVRATPAARRIARESNVPIEAVAQRLDHDGPVTQADVEAYLAELDG